MPFHELINPATGRTQVRKVDCSSEHYVVARKYMIRLEQRDLDDPCMTGKLAEAARMAPKEFIQEFSPAAQWAVGANVI